MMERKQKAPGIDREAVRLFQKIQMLKTLPNYDTWEERGGHRRQWLDASLALHEALGRRSWECEVDFCAAKRGPEWIPRGEYREAHKIFRELQRAANDAR
jgi:hypothetical protein